MKSIPPIQEKRLFPDEKIREDFPGIARKPGDGIPAILNKLGYVFPSDKKIGKNGTRHPKKTPIVKKEGTRKAPGSER